MASVTEMNARAATLTRAFREAGIRGTAALNIGGQLQVWCDYSERSMNARMLDEAARVCRESGYGFARRDRYIEVLPIA